MAYPLKQRDRIELVMNILNGISRSLPITRIMMSSNTNYAYMKRIISNLHDGEIIKVDKDYGNRKVRYYLTEKGAYLHKLLHGFTHFLSIDSNSGATESIEFLEEDKNQLKDKLNEVVGKILCKKRRTRIEIYVTVISSVLDTPRTLSSIANKCFLNTKQAKQYIDELLDLNMLEEISVNNNRRKYSITPRGLQFLEMYLRIHELLFEPAYKK